MVLTMLAVSMSRHFPVMRMRKLSESVFCVQSIQNVSGLCLRRYLADGILSVEMPVFFAVHVHVSGLFTP